MHGTGRGSPGHLRRPDWEAVDGRFSPHTGEERVGGEGGREREKYKEREREGRRERRNFLFHSSNSEAFGSVPPIYPRLFHDPIYRLLAAGKNVKTHPTQDAGTGRRGKLPG